MRRVSRYDCHHDWRMNLKMPGKPIRISQIIHDTSSLRRLLGQSRIQQQLNARLHGFLPSPLRDHCRLAAIDRDNATLQASSPVWSSRLRYLTPAILEFLRGPCAQEQLRSLRIRVTLPERQRPGSTGHRTTVRRISSQAAESLRKTAQHCSDAGIRKILLKLSAHGRK